MHLTCGSDALWRGEERASGWCQLEGARVAHARGARCGRGAAGGVMLAMGVLLALLERAKSGKGQARPINVAA